MDCMTNDLRLVFGDMTLGVSGEGFEYIFSYAMGGLESLRTAGKEWIYRAPKPTFWRATTCNDRGSRFPLKSGMWLAADMFIKTAGICVALDDEVIPLPIAPENNRYNGTETAKKVTVAFVYETITVPSTVVTVKYTVTAGGRMNISCAYTGREGLPQLPVFGLRMIMPTKATGFTYEGLSGETYPDRKAGGVPGVYTVEGLPVTPYMVPQECGMHMDTKWVEVTRDTVLDNTVKGRHASSLRIENSGEPFAFSCLPYTCEELENATHHEELPPARRTVLCVYGAVRGVGGIDSWGSDVEEAWHIDAAKDITFSFDIVPQ